jgi:subtilisin family serine protease
MQKKIFIILFLFVQIVLSKEYFVHLTNTGFAHRHELLQNNFSFLSNNPINQSSKPVFKEIMPLGQNSSPLKMWVTLKLNSDQEATLKSLESQNIIDFFEPVGHFKIELESNDSLVAEQWYLDKINLAPAWQITKGDPEIIVGIIDTGVDYLHPDLEQAIWVNRAEDLNNNGRLDEADLNNIDDDGNGFVDDVIGWDFTDAPRFADGGDFKDPDNQPMDEFGTGHGTQVAGLIAATDNNETGIAGIAPGVKIMNLRAGTATGYLEEDDVARAVLYAIENGARIINMSFGDTALSRFLRDIIKYAHGQGVVIVSSAGNSATDEVHFPSGLVETIAVGASTETDGLAGFSSFGNTIDLVAPGTNIISTAIGGKYNSVNGTSFSAPIVSAVSALILSQNPQLGPGQVRNILKTSADDILFSGWDEFSGSGRVSALEALNIPYGGVLEIFSPVQNRTTAENLLAVLGSAAHPDLIKTTIEFGLGKLPTTWNQIAVIEVRQVVNDTLTLLNTSLLPDTVVTIKVVMDLFNAQKDEIHTTFSVDRSPPEITDVNIVPLWDGLNSSLLVTFETDDICTSRLMIRQSESDNYEAVASPYESKSHRIKVDKQQFSGQIKFYIEAQNVSQLKSRSDNAGKNFHFTLDGEFKWRDFIKVNWQLPAGYMLDRFTDFDHDGNKEIVISRYDENSAFGPLEIYEFNNGRFELRFSPGFTAIPRAAGDVDGDGKSDLLLGLGQYSFILEAKDLNSFPTELVWQDTTGFWAAAYADLDNDGKNEIIGRIENEYIIRENTADNSFTEIARLVNPSSGQNRLGVPKVEVTDLNRDGIDELIFGDNDRDLIVFTSSGNNQFEIFSTGETIHLNPSEMISSDSNGQIFTATHTSDDLNFEHEFDARYWSIQFFSNSDSTLISSDTINTFGFSATKDFDSGLRFAQFDGRDLLFASFFPELFIFEKINNIWEPIWINNQSRSNTVLVGDLDKDGNDEFYFNNGSKIIAFTNSQTKRPVTPYFFSASPLDSVRIILEWSSIENADHYNIYRGEDIDNLTFWTNSGKLSIVDTSEYIGQKLFYGLITVDSSFEIAESFFSKIDSAQTAIPPKAYGIEFKNDRQIFIYFDSTIVLNQDKRVTVKRLSKDELASSAILNNSGKSLLVSFDTEFIEGEQDSLEIENIFGVSQVPIDKEFQKIPYFYSTVFTAPYVLKTTWISKTQMKINFSEPMIIPQKISFSLPVQPSGGTETIQPDSLGKSIIVTFNNQTFLGASGQKSFLLLRGLYSAKGIALEGVTAISLFRESANLEKLIIYPQPVKPADKELTFANLPVGEIKINIYSINGLPIRKIIGYTNYGGISWDLKDSTGNKVATGLYIFTLKWKDKTKLGKLVIVK